MVSINQELKKNNTLLDRLHREIIHRSTGRLLIRPHLNPDWKVGFIGEPGDCKTISGVKLLIRDFMFHGVKCFSNMGVKVAVEISDDNPYCQALDIPGGEVIYEAELLDKLALFRLDNRYLDSAIFCDEVNLELAESRRSSSNTNLNLNKVGQELRKLHAAFIYTVISELWVDGRIRQLTDIFIKTQDTALDFHNLERKQLPGLNARWNLHAMSRKLTGTTYYQTRTPIGPFYTNVRAMWEVFDTDEMQATESLKYGLDLKAVVETEKSAKLEAAKAEYGWLLEYPEMQSIAQRIEDGDIVEIAQGTIFEMLSIHDEKPDFVMSAIDTIMRYELEGLVKWSNGQKVYRYLHKVRKKEKALV